MTDLLAFFNQSFHASDMFTVGLLIVLEGVLSIDNALVLGLLAKRLPKHMQKRALTYGLVGAFVFRVIAIFTATLLLKLPVMKLIGGGYLAYVALKHFFFETTDPTKEDIRIGPDGHPILEDAITHQDLSPEEREREIAERAPIHAGAKAAKVAFAAFWPTVIVIELTDIAFAIDSILAAMAFIPPSVETPNPKLWVVIVGGMLGVILMRFAAVVFIRLLEKFPRFEVSAYLLVFVIGLKLCMDWLFNNYLYPRPADLPVGHEYHGPLNFHSLHDPAFWVFWGLMLFCFAIGFFPQREKRGLVEEPSQAAGT